jgi:PAS domain-containing protein
VLLWEVYTTARRRRRARMVERIRGEIERLRAEEALNLSRARINATRLESVIANTSDGFALFDSGQRLVQWNVPFARGVGVELRQDMPLDDLLREQIGRAGAVAEGCDTDVEMTRRAVILRTGEAAGIPNRGPDGEALILRGLPIEQGGVVLVLNGFATWQPSPVPAGGSRVEDANAPQPAATLPMEL